MSLAGKKGIDRYLTLGFLNKNTQNVAGISYTFTSKEQKDKVEKSWLVCGVYLISMGLLSMLYLLSSGGVRFLTSQRNISFINKDLPISASLSLQFYIFLCSILIAAGISFAIISTIFEYNPPPTGS